MFPYSCSSCGLTHLSYDDMCVYEASSSHYMGWHMHMAAKDKSPEEAIKCMEETSRIISECRKKAFDAVYGKKEDESKHQTLTIEKLSLWQRIKRKLM